MKHDPCPQWVHNLAKIETIKKIQRTTCKELGENYILDAQSISNYNMATNHLEILLKCRFWFCRHRMRWDSAFSMSSHVMPMLLIHGPHWVQFSSVQFSSVQYSSVTQLGPTLCHPMDCSTPGFPFHHQLPELAQTHVHRVGDATQPSHSFHPLLLLPSIFSSIRVFSNDSVLQVTKVLEFQFQHQSFQWIFRTDFL